MNKKIKELMGQTLDSKFSHTWTALNYADLEKFSEKLVELTVQHCIEGIKEWRDASDEHMDKEEYWKGYRSGCNDAIVEIMLSFKDEE
jgi:hypothetical protein